MQGHRVHIASQAISYIEDHLNDKLELEAVAAALHYSKYHLHRMFTKEVGLTIHEYARRRQLTEAARRLTGSRKSILEIALMSGYESQQSFTDTFKAMYKTTPARYREEELFYPLQLAIRLKEKPTSGRFTKEDIIFAMPEDMEDWMELVCLTIDGYPRLKKEAYIRNLRQYIGNQRALILRDGRLVIGAMGFSSETGSIDFWAIHPQYRYLGIAKRFLDKLADELPYGKEITVTTYRAGDKADTGYREAYYRHGFTEKELLVEYGYPTQSFVLHP